ICAVNRGPEPAILHVLPTLWFRNTWCWGLDDRKPVLRQGLGHEGQSPIRSIEAEHSTLGNYLLHCEAADDLLFTENETNAMRLFGAPNASPYVKDAFHDYLIAGKREAVNPARVGTKAAALYSRTIGAGATLTLRLRLSRVIDDDSARTIHSTRAAARAARTIHGGGPRGRPGNDSLRPGDSEPFGDFDAIF